MPESSTSWVTAESLVWSEDGYIRLTFQRFCQLSFARRLSIADDDLRSDLVAQDVPAFAAGYCDWLDISTPVRISIGWAWFATDPESPQLLAPGGVSSNVMITSPDGSDLGPSKTNELLKSWLSSQCWQEGPRRQPGIVHREPMSVH